MDEELKREQVTTQIAKPDTSYTDPYAGQLRDLYTKITERKPFEYNADDDAMYQQYRDRYMSLGRDAMRDTMGQASALTGGYGNSYAQSVGQQVYDKYMQGLNDKGLELYQLAYGRWEDADNRDRQDYAMLNDLADKDYGRYRDEMSDWFIERNYQRQADNEEYDRRVAEDQTAYNRQKDKLSRQQQLYTNLYATIMASGYMPSDAELAEAGMSREQAQAIASEFRRGVELENRNQALKEWQLGMSIYGTGGGYGGVSSSAGSSGGGRSSDNYSTRSSGGGNDVASIQRQLNAMGANLDVDGIWGPLTEVAYNRYMGGGGDIWTESQDQYRQYGYQNTSNDLRDLYDTGAITKDQYVTGQTAADILWTQDHATNIAKSVASKQQSSSKPKTAGEDWNAIRKKLGI